MKAVSAAYREQIERGQRNQSYVRIVYNQIDTAAATDGTYLDNGHVLYSDTAFIDTKFTPESTYATLEQNRFLLDGTQELLPEIGYHNEGYVGDAISGADGRYALPRPTLIREFDLRHAIVGMTITFDAVLNEFPKHIIIRFFNNNTQVLYVDIDNISSPTISFERQVQSFNKYSIEFVQSDMPYRRARLQGVSYGLERVFTNDQIESTTQVEDVDPIARRLPTETLSLTIFDFEQEYNPENPTGQWEYVDTQSPISIQYGYTLDGGDIEWLEPDYYLLDGKPNVQNNRATFSATKQLGYLTGRYYKGTAGTKTLYDMAEDVLEDAGLPLTEALEKPWQIDPSLLDISTDAVLPIDTHRNCLQLIAYAGMCRLYTDAKGFVCLKKMSIPSEAESFVLDFAKALEKPVVTKVEPLLSINVIKHTNTVDNEETQLHTSTFEVNGTTPFYAEFGAAEDVSVNIDGGVLSDVRVYAQAASAIITASGEVTITITGKQIKTSISGVPKIVSLDNKGEEEVIENKLITSDTHKSALESHIADYLQFRSTYSLGYRGNPEVEAGDLIEMQSQFSQSFPAFVLKHSITFNGALKGAGIFKGIWFKRNSPYYAGEFYAGESMGVI